MSFLRCCAQNHYRCVLLDDFAGEGDLGENASVSHLCLCWAAVGAAGFECCYRAGCESDVAESDSQVAGVAHVDFRERGWDTTGAGNDCEIESDGGALSEMLGFQADM